MNRQSMKATLLRYIEDPMTATLSKFGITPNIVTMCGLAITVVSAVFISLGQFWLGGVLLLTGSLFDLIDGSLARKLGQDSKFGALLDSVVDRLSETVILLGLLIFYIGESSNLAEILVYVAVSGSLMVSYLRARSEGLGIECSSGIMTRPERVIVMSVGLIVGEWVSVVTVISVGIIGFFTIVTTFQRLLIARSKLGS